MPDAERHLEIAESLDALTASPAWYLYVQTVRKYFNPLTFQQRIETISEESPDAHLVACAIGKVVAAHGTAEELLSLPAREAAHLRRQVAPVEEPDGDWL